jgi:hypothetical protein
MLENGPSYNIPGLGFSLPSQSISGGLGDSISNTIYINVTGVQDPQANADAIKSVVKQILDNKENKMKGLSTQRVVGGRR